MRVCLGGTFDPFHVGHEALLCAAARAATALFVGVTDGPLARRERTVATWEERARRVERFLRDAGYAGGLSVRPLTDGHGPAVTGDYQAIAATPETVRGARAINQQRAALGKAPLHVIAVPHVLADDLRPVSATRVARGDIDRAGRRLRPVRVAVGSANDVKVRAVQAELEALLGPEVEVEVTGHAVDSGVPEQPRDEEVMRGADARARAACMARPDCDYAVGVEAGLVRMPGDDSPVDVQACVVLDGDGLRTQGWGPGFAYPEWVTRRALAGEMVSAILGPVAKDDRIGATTGAIGYLTRGRLDRVGLTRTALLMAFVPRLRRELYLDAQATDGLE